MRKDNSRTKAYLAIFIMAVMVLSTFGFIVANDSSQDSSINGFEFIRRDNVWVTTVDENEYSFIFHPSELSVDVSQEIIDMIRQSPTITITFEPNSTIPEYVDIARFELSQYLTSSGKNVAAGVLSNTTVYEFPLVTCSPLGSELTIKLQESNESGAFKEGNCITIEVNSPSDFIAYAERIMYSLLGIL